MDIIEHMSAKEHISRNIMMHIGKYTEETVPYYHSHEFLEIQYVISGSGKQIIDGIEFDVSKGNVSFTNFVTRHSFVSAGKEDPIVVFNCIFFPEYFENLDFDSGSASAKKLIYDSKLFMMPYFSLRDEDNALYSILDMMHNEYVREDSAYENVIRGYFIALINVIGRLYKKQTGDMPFIVADADINKAIMYIEKHYKEKIRLETLAKIALLSPNYFCAKFKEATNTTVINYINKKRMREICRLLRDTNESFSDISMSVGYTNINYIRNLFKKEFGESPAEYRKRTKG